MQPLGGEEMAAAPFSFVLPGTLNAAAPPERRGLRRDRVRLLVLDWESGERHHSRFDRLGDFLRPGDLLVLNNSRTLPASLPAEAPDGTRLEIRLARRLGEAEWAALLVPDPAVPAAPGAPLTAVPPAGAGTVLRLSPDLTATLTGLEGPLRHARFSLSGPDLTDALYRVGRPIRYEYIDRSWDLDYYQNVFASVPGSVEMPSAGRPFTWELLQALRRRGIGLAFLSLHTGLSWYGPGWRALPQEVPEPFTITRETAGAIDRTRQRGGRVIAVGTTVVRALESAADPAGGWKQLSGEATCLIGPGYRLRVAHGLLTGWHEPEASHLDMLTAFAPVSLLAATYREALERGYLWHEFGDACLIL
jgi:S-adenosylmethionine:tRNA ribosyltransferase-isomerase